MMLQNVGTSYFLSVDKLCQDSNESGYTVIQEVRTWIDPQAYWFMAPLWMGRSFRPLWSTTKRLLPCRVVIRPIACTSCLYLSWISDLPWSGYRLCLCISACSPYFHNLFDLVSGLCSNVSFPSEILPKYSEWWLLHSSCVLCDGHSSVLRTLLWLTLTGLHSKTTWVFPAGELPAGLCWLPIVVPKAQWPWFTWDGKLHRVFKHVYVWSMLNLCYYHASDYVQFL